MTMQGGKTVIGVDTGGTFTDAVLVDIPSGRVIAWSKVRTDRNDLCLSIGKCLEKLISTEPSAVRASAVNLSTTLATNAIVEERMRPVCLILIGYERNSFEAWSFGESLPTHNVVFIDGGHNRHGKESAPLDEKRIRNTAVFWRDRVEAFAISSLFGNRNPDHEIRARAIINESSNLPCSCGHELSGELNTLARASTAALNAGLVPTVREWLDAMQETFAGAGIHAPVYVVRGDGSLMSSAWAKERPVETILSGPAASIAGAAHLAPESSSKSFVALDMGGTTTDMAFWGKGSPVISTKGVMVGRYKVMAPSIDIRTIALGGDSQVHIGPSKRALSFGPLRAVPLCLLTEAGITAVPSIVETGAGQKGNTPKAPVFLLAGASILEKNILSRVRDAGFITLTEAVAELQDHGGMEKIMNLVRAGVFELAAFTPTDALAALGKLPFGDGRISRDAACLMARLGGFQKGEDFSREVIRAVSKHLAQFVLEEILERHGFSQSDRLFLNNLSERMLSGRKGNEPVSMEAALHVPLVGMGAPAGAFIPKAARMLKTHGIIPSESPVANATGAAMAATSVRKGVLILPLPDGGGFRVHLPTGVADAGSIENAVGIAEEFMKGWLAGVLDSQGVEKPVITMTREENAVILEGRSLLLDIVLWFEATKT